MAILVAALRCGYACGLQHRFECYRNYERMLYQFMEYEKVNKAVEEFWNAALEFEKSITSCPEEEEEMKNYTLADLFEDINIWYTTPAR
jgi:hypothetical protein